MSEKEVNTISHLLEMERKAEELTSQTQEEASKKIASAKASADSKFKAEYEKIVSECERDYNQKVDELNKKSLEEISSYKERILRTPKDSGSFNAFLDSVLAK